MNFYRVPLLFIFFGPWLVAGLGEKPKDEETTATRKKITEETTFPLNLLPKIATRTRALAQSFRRLLKMMRKWWRSHPPEVKLGRCFANYFNIKIPELRRYEQVDGYNDNPKKTKPEAKKRRRGVQIPNPFDRQHKKSIQFKISLDNWPLKPLKGVLSTIRSAYNLAVDKFQQYREFFNRNQLIVCLWDYFLKKFWIWVDTAPDS